MNLIKSWNNRTIRFREDGYICLTDMAKANGKLTADWQRLKSTKEYLQALEASMIIPIDELLQSKEGGNVPEDQRGTWAHRRVAIRFAQWCSPQFAVQVDSWVEELFTTGKVEIVEPEIPQPQQQLPPKRDAVEYMNAATQLQSLPNGILKQLLGDMLVDEISLQQNLKYLPVAENPKQYTIAKVRAKQLGYSDKQIGNGQQLGKFVKSQIAPAFQELIGRYPVHHYEINPTLDSVIHSFFA